LFVAKVIYILRTNRHKGVNMKRLACIILIIALFVSGLFFVKTTYGITVGGTLTVDTHWTAANSPVIFNGTVMVNNNVTLTIDPGVTVNLGIYGLFVSGTLNATGTANNEITFMASAISNYTISVSAPIVFGPTSTPWSDATNSGSIIQNANLNQIDLQISSASPKIDSCTFSFQTSYIAPISISGGSPIISGNTISYNVQGSGSGNVNSVIVYSGNPLITNNRFDCNYYSSTSNDITVSSGSPTISNNIFDGAYSSSNNNGITVNSGTPLISNNQFQGNGFLTAIVDESSAAFTISNNIFSSCLSGITTQAGSTLTVSGNSFLDGTDGIYIATGASVTVSGNLINHNSRFGILGGGNISSNTITNNQVGIHNPPSGIITNNNIVSNTVNSIDATTSDIDAENNWWGTTDTQTINQTIYDSKVDNRLGTVSFVPFLTQPSSSAPPIPVTTPVVTPIPTLLATPQPTETVTITTPTSTPIQYSQTFIYQIGSIFNINTIVVAIAIVLVLAWIIVILGYGVKRHFKIYIKQERPE